ncbi:hypothetical protein [Methylobacterium sp. OT2]|nr:hypothetical protein [Methylobacterium sp. OT2]MBN4098392.1 hypothetical protein [Methylobacterium sp. OT2]
MPTGPILGRGAASTDRRRDLGRRLSREAKRIAAIFAYLWVVFAVLVLHESLVLSRHGLSSQFYGLAFVNAWILAKVMLVAEGLDARPHFEGRPLILPIALRSAGFAVLLVCAYAVEETVINLWKGQGLVEAVPAIGGGGVRGFAVMTVIMAIALGPYFTWRELGRVLGRDRLKALMFSGRDVSPGA